MSQLLGKDIEYISKFARRPGCDSKKGVWLVPMEDVTTRKYMFAARALQLRETHLVLDLGAGCGNHLAALLEASKVKLVAQDLLQSNLAHIKGLGLSNLVGVCAGDALQFLETTPANTYDAVLSNYLIAVYPVPTRCKIVNLVMQAVRPLGKVWFGGNPYDSGFNESWWESFGVHADVEVYDEKSFFGESEYGREKVLTAILTKHARM